MKKEGEAPPGVALGTQPERESGRLALLHHSVIIPGILGALGHCPYSASELPIRSSLCRVCGGLRRSLRNSRKRPYAGTKQSIAPNAPAPG